VADQLGMCGGGTGYEGCGEDDGADGSWDIPVLLAAR
jgi:hypothetical protein